MKVCKTCLTEKSLDDFYKHKMMSSGYLNQCIECVKAREKKRREVKADYIKAYDKARANNPDRVEARKEYAKTEQGVLARQRARKVYEQKFPVKRAAHIIFGNAVRRGKIVRAKSCSTCQSTEKIEGHHDDYTQPLKVRWLCEKCHKTWHKYNQPNYE